MSSDRGGSALPPRLEAPLRPWTRDERFAREGLVPARPTGAVSRRPSARLRRGCVEGLTPARHGVTSGALSIGGLERRRVAEEHLCGFGGGDVADPRSQLKCLAKVAEELGGAALSTLDLD